MIHNCAKEANDNVESSSAPQPEQAKKRMKPNYFEECCPILSLEAAEQVLEEPPSWVERIVSLARRRPTVLQNHMSDCHAEPAGLVPRPRIDARFAPKTLVCHDYKGGYLEDRHFAKTTTGPQYTFYNWAHIDVFVYFSHHLITVPPLCWTNAAHRRGVKMLGTFITEAAGGAQVCAAILENTATVRRCAETLARIAQTFKFDGWLLNIENPVADTAPLKRFVELLTQLIHQQSGHKLVIWYDSVVETGLLRWQNELNDLNRCFFDRCDGIFLNYVWTEAGLRGTARAAQHRHLDVYVGVDVFGRNTFGGGGFNSYKAAQVIRRHNLSMAVFAPGWTFETLPPPGSDAAQLLQAFANRDAGFWSSLWPFLYTHPIAEPFTTDFYIGTDRKAFNMFEQKVQLSKIRHPMKMLPEFNNVLTLENKCKCLQLECSHDKMQCLITKQVLITENIYIHRLFSCDFELNGIVTVFFATENVNDTEMGELSIVLIVSTGNDHLQTICLHSTTKSLKSTLYLTEVNPSNNENLIESLKKQFEYLNKANIKLNVYEFLANGNLLEVGCSLDQGNSAYLCGFGIINSANNIW